MRTLRYMWMLLLVLLSGCDKGASNGGSSRAESDLPGPDPETAKDSVELRASAMLPAMRAHLDSARSSGAMRPAAMHQHEVRVRSFVQATENDMQRLGMHSDPAYEALVDSVLRGLDQLANAKGSNLERLAAQHFDRVQRLTSVYEQMVAPK